MNIKEFLLLQILNQKKSTGKDIATGTIAAAVEGDTIILTAAFPNFPGYMSIAFRAENRTITSQYIREGVMGNADITALSTKIVPEKVNTEEKSNVIQFKPRNK